MAQKIISDFFKEFHNDNKDDEDLDRDYQDLQNEDLMPKYPETPQDFKGQLTNIEDIIKYATAGNATLTLKSMKTSTRFTYKIQKPKEINQNSPVKFFVKLLNGPDNHNNYQYMGCIYTNNSYKLGKKSKITEIAPSHIAFNWFWNHVVKNKHLPDNQIEIWHEGNCCRCGRKLTVPNSVAKGIGPECEKHMGM